MMPGMVAESSVTVGRLATDTEVFGGREPGAPARVGVRVSFCLSFHELMGLLLYTPGLSLTYEELEADLEVRESLQYAVLMTDLETLEFNADKAAKEYRAALAGRCQAPRFVLALAQSVTRVFGVSA